MINRIARRIATGIDFDISVFPEWWVKAFQKAWHLKPKWDPSRNQRSDQDDIQGVVDGIKPVAHVYGDVKDSPAYIKLQAPDSVTIIARPENRELAKAVKWVCEHEDQIPHKVRQYAFGLLMGYPIEDLFYKHEAEEALESILPQRLAKPITQGMRDFDEMTEIVDQAYEKVYESWDESAEWDPDEYQKAATLEASKRLEKAGFSFDLFEKYRDTNYDDL